MNYKQVAISDFDVIQILENHQDYIFTPGFKRKFNSMKDVVECAILYCRDEGIITKIEEKEQ